MSAGTPEYDSGWVGAGPDDDLDRMLRDEVDEWDPTHPRVETVLGPVAPGALGPVLAAEPLVSLTDLSTDINHGPDGRHGMLAELEDAYASGARTVVSVPTPADAPGAQLLNWLAGRSQVHVIRLAAPGDLPEGDGELPAGVAGIAASAASPVELSRAINLAAAWRCALRVEEVSGADHAVAVVERAVSRGVSLDRCSVAPFKALSPGEMGSIVEIGCTLVMPGSDWPDAPSFAEAIAALVAHGDADRILVSPGLRRPTDLLARGGTRGLGWLVERLPLALMEAGVEAVDVRRILVDNPARTLTIEPGGA